MMKNVLFGPIWSNKIPVSKELTTPDRLTVAFKSPCEVTTREGGASLRAYVTELIAKKT